MLSAVVRVPDIRQALKYANNIHVGNYENFREQVLKLMFSNIQFILLLCVGDLIAHWSDGEGGPISCPGDEKVKNAAVKQNLRRLIVKYANKHREPPFQKIVTYDCNLEKKARPGIKGDGFDMEMLKKQKYMFSDYEEELAKGKDLKDYLENGLMYWWRASSNKKHTIGGRDNNRIGCHYKKGKLFHFVCLYDQVPE